MAREGTERRLAAILSADVVGYSRLMGEDEPEIFKSLVVRKSPSKCLLKPRQGGSCLTLERPIKRLVSLLT